MNVSALVSAFGDKGVSLWEESGRIRYRAPRGVMTPELLDALRSHKDQVLEHLRQAAAGGQVWRAEPESREDPFLLTDVQAAYLLGRGDLFPYGGVPCHIYLEIPLPADTDPARLAAAWDGLLARHDMLRAVISDDGFQRVLPKAPASCAIRHEDLRGAVAGEAAAAIERVRHELSHRMHPLGDRPLYEVRLTLTDNRALLHLSVDFIAFDYVSIQLLLAELDQRYRDPDAELPRLEATYRDYLQAYHRRRTGEAYEKHRTYWLERLDELPEAPSLPLRENGEGESPATGPAHFTRYGTVLSAQRWQSLKKRATQHGVTPSGAVLAAYAEIIGRWSGRSRFGLNLTLLNRQPLHPQVDRLVGDFTSVSILAVDAGSALTFPGRARALGAQLFDDLDHNLFSGVEVLRELARVKGRDAALMPVVFTSGIGVASRAVAATGGRAPRPVHGISQTPQVWIDCQAGDQFSDLEVNWDVRGGVFPDELVETMFASFAELLRRLADDDECWTGLDPAGLPRAQRERRIEVNATDCETPDVLLHEPLVQWALAQPDRVALIDTAGPVTYAEWLRHAGAVATALRAVGCGSGELVAILIEKGRDQLAAVLGVLLAGGVYMPVEIDQPQERRNAIITASGSRFALVCHRHVAGLSGDLPDSVKSIAVDGLEPAEPLGRMPQRLVGTDALAYVIHTSGSTGMPKGVMISHRAAANTVHDINSRHRVSEQDRVLGLAALGFDLSVYDIFGPPAVGAAVVLPDPNRHGDSSHWAELLARHGITIWNSVPAQMQMLADYLGHEPSVAAGTRLRLALLSGDWIPLGLPDHVHRLLPQTDLVSMGGATEAAIWSIAYPIGEVQPHWRSVPYGRPLANQKFHVLDAAMRDCPDLVAGELYISGAGLAEGYLNDARQSMESFPRHPGTGERLYRTGDLGRYLPDGDIEFLGRRDQQVKIRGHRIELGEVEAALARHPAVGAAAVGADGTAMERRLVAFVEPAVADEHTRRVAADQAAMVGRAAKDAAADSSGQALPSRARLAEYVRTLDDLMLLGYVCAMAESGLFAPDTDGHAFEEIAARTGTVPEHRGLLRRALRALERHGWLQQEPATGKWVALHRPGPDAFERAWQAFEHARPAEICSAALAEYFQASARAVPSLLRGEINATHLFFPQGDLGLARDWYADNVTARRLNAILAGVVGGIAAGHAGARPLRVLEVGGGIGAATESILAALAGVPKEYLFTDVSRFFLSTARERFGDQRGVHFGLFDMNSAQDQGLAPNSFDLVVSAGALNNARDTVRVLERLTELVAPGGWLAFLDLSREHAEVTASQAFMMEDPQDLRCDRDAVFVDRQQWLTLLTDAGGESVLCLPEPDDPLSLLGQHVFAARFKADRSAVSSAELVAWLRTRLPEYMVPNDVQVLDAIPLTRNGKVDRRKLAGRAARGGGERTTDGSGAPKDELERRIARYWSAALGGTEVSRNQDFFESGGDSLLAARLVGNLRAQLPEAALISFDVLLRGLLRAPRLAAVADILRRAGDESTAAASVPPTGGGRRSTAAGSALVPLGGSGPGPLRVLVHEGLGTLAPLRTMARELSAYGPVAGLAVPDTDAYLSQPAGTLIESLAADYARELVVAGHRRVAIVGYCSGGLIATELARTLADTGVAVDRLTVVSSYRIPYRIDDELMIQYAFVRAMGGKPGELGWPADERSVSRALRSVLTMTPDRIPARALAKTDGDPSLAELAARFARLAAADQGRRLDDLWTALAHLDAGLESPTYTASLYQVFRLTVDAVTRYEPPPYAGDITFLRPRQPTHFIPGMHHDMTAFWKDLCLGELSVVDVPGDHFGCVQHPHARSLSQAIVGEQTAGAHAPAGR